ncbi:MAG: tRNA (adenosine(37)-N6)-threonylcarbamoyltransferase complex transferase subunit TsaD [Alphaproteobacteria bacterium]|nr:tRNA (adenosine(37)-N6)-threonylcarbamoyltransferase complex transferase subunit TsaD [Alphaproteobacteria bacterium]
MITLGIETSCDDTAVGIIRTAADKDEILASETFTQTEQHACYGGVVPEIASRAHLEKIDITIAQALASANLSIADIDLFAAGAGPGLIGGVIVGLNMAKSLALSTGKPFVAVNHLEAHALMPAMFSNTLKFPYLLLLASGGHTQILWVEKAGAYKLLGATLDDAAGECFDKVAKVMGYNYMGGKYVEEEALQGDPSAFAFPRPLLHSGDFNMSFSGLKTSVLNTIAKEGLARKADIAASFQAAVCDVIDAKMRACIDAGYKGDIVASGGVLCNKTLRAALERVASDTGVGFFAPPLKYCVDNGVMIAYAGQERFKLFGATPLDIKPRPRWPLSEI